MKINLYKHRPNKDGIFQVRLSATIATKDRKITTIGALSERDFDFLLKRVEGGKFVCGGEVEKVYNLFVSIRSELERVELGILGGFVNPQDVELLDIVNRCKGKEKKGNSGKETIENIMIRYISDGEKLSSWSDGTITQTQKMCRSILSFGAELSELSRREGLEKYEKSLVNKGLNNNTIKQNMLVAKSFLRWCYINGYCDNDFERYRCKLKTADTKEKVVIYLTMGEIEKIKAVELPVVQKAIRDVFLFQCYTGLRFSDVINLRWSDINGDRISLTTKKTATHITNKLPKQAIELIEEYRGRKYANDHVFPNYNNSTYNGHLKIIARDAGVCDIVTFTEYRNGKRVTKHCEKWEKITTHVGRKTFVVNSLSMGYTADQVIKYTGHSSTQAMKPYIDITDESKDALADKWSELMK